jgi:DNA-binding Xre family transcriptional regulator
VEPADGGRPAWHLAGLRPAAGLEISGGKMSHLWSGQPISVRLDDLEVICQVLDCEPGELLLRQAAAGAAALPGPEVAASSIRPAPRRGSRTLPPV